MDKATERTVTNKRDIKSTTTYSIAVTALFTAIIAVFSQISIPIGPVPINLALLGVFLAAGILGLKRGVISVAVYIMLGVVGLPVFSNFGGGIGKLAGPTGGYIIGYLFAVLIVGLAFVILKKQYESGTAVVKSIICVLSMTIGLAVCYTFGTIWYSISVKIDFMAALMVCVVPFLIGDAAKIAIATILTLRLRKIVNK